MTISPDAALGAGVTVGLFILGGLAHVSMKLGRLDALTSRELTHNGGSTLKDNARDGAESAKRAVLIADEARSQAAALRKELGELKSVTDHQSRESQTALVLVAARDESMRKLLGTIQHDITNMRTGQGLLLHQQDDLRARVDKIDRERAEHDRAVAAALHESLDLAIVAADAAEQQKGT